ncbi:MAG: type II secretion system protein N [Gallionellaceae bacterium]
MGLGVGKMVIQLETAYTAVLAVFSRLPVSWRGIAAVVIAVLLARWTWILFAPQTMAVHAPKPDIAKEVSSALFGTAASTTVTSYSSLLPSVHLLGVFSGKQGFAILKLDERKQRGVALGEEIINGIRLIKVESDRVVLEHNGVRQQVNLENKYANSKGLIVESATSSPDVEKAMAEWTQARQAMQKGR